MRASAEELAPKRRHRVTPVARLYETFDPSTLDRPSNPGVLQLIYAGNIPRSIALCDA